MSLFRLSSAFQFVKAPRYRSSKVLQINFLPATQKYSTMPQFLVAKFSEIGEGKMKEVSLDSGDKVLLSKIQGQIYATSHKCTHYGAPLVKGVLSSDGRIVCPWHGACFSAMTGDIEDAPALDKLQTFKVTIVDEDVFIDADEQTLKSGRRTVCGKANPENTETVVILGGGPSGNAAAEKLRDEGFTGQIIVVSKESYLPIDRVKLSKSLGITIEKALIRNLEFYNTSSIVFKLDTAAESVDPAAKTVSLSNGEKLKYDKLIIATGSSPRAIPIPGINLENVFYLRTVQDNNKIDQAIGNGDNKKNLVIIGSSFIGMEVASVAIKKANVTVIGMEKVPFQRILGEKIGAALQQLHETSGIKFYMNATVKSIEPSDIEPKKAASVTLQDGTKIAADFVVIGAGVAPATQFLKGSNAFPLQRDGGLKVDENFKVEGLEDIYAIGDIAIFPYHLTNESLRIEHWSHAENTGNAVASIIAKKKLSPFRKIPYFWTAQQGKGLRYTGYATSFDDVIIDGSLEEFKFAAYYAREDRILAVLTVARDPLASHCAELLRLGKFPTITQIRSGLDPLNVPL